MLNVTSTFDSANIGQWVAIGYELFPFPQLRLFFAPISNTFIRVHSKVPINTETSLNIPEAVSKYLCRWSSYCSAVINSNMFKGRCKFRVKLALKLKTCPKYRFSKFYKAASFQRSIPTLQSKLTTRGLVPNVSRDGEFNERFNDFSIFYMFHENYPHLMWALSLDSLMSIFINYDRMCLIPYFLIDKAI